MHILGKLAIIGAVLWIVGFVGAFTVSTLIAWGDSAMATSLFMVFSVIGAIGFFTFPVLFCCIFGKNEKKDKSWRARPASP